VCFTPVPNLSVGITAWVSPRITRGRRAETAVFIPGPRAIAGTAAIAEAAVEDLSEMLRSSLGYGPQSKLHFMEGYTLPPYDIVPFYVETDWQNGVSNTFWSDTYDYWFWDRSVPKPNNCYTVCDNERSDAYTTCQLGAGVAVAGCGVGVGIVATVITGNPVAGVALGAASGATCGAAFTVACYARADQHRVNCRAVCG